MKTKNTPHKKTPLAAAHDFAGFSDWFEIFIGGKQTDSLGRTKDFTTEDLDSVVANFEADTVPMVIGHPKATAPSYGWLSAVKREGKKLYAKAEHVAAEFEEAVKNKFFPKRSVSLLPDGNGGYRLRHLGWLGAVPPAVKGLADLNFESDASEALEFVENVDSRDVGIGFTRMARLLRGLRDWIISDKSIEEADRIIPDYEIEGLSSLAERIQNEGRDEPGLSYSQHTNEPDPDNPKQETPPMPEEKTYSEAEMQAMKDKLAAAETAKKNYEKEKEELAYKEKLANAKTFVTGAVKDGKLTPAMANGMAEFMASLADDKEAAFDFSEGEGEKAQTVSKTPYDFFKGLLDTATPVMSFGTQHDGDDPGQGGKQHDFAAPDGMAVDDERAALHSKALEYQEQKGCDYATAIQAVSKQ